MLTGPQNGQALSVARPIADFIPEHQGTLRMGFFLHQAGERPVI